MPLEPTDVPVPGALEQHVQVFAGRNLHLAPDLADAQHEVADPVEFRLGVFVHREVRRDRVGLVADGPASHRSQGRDLLPYLLGDERHDRVDQPQQRLQDLDERAAGPALLGLGTVVGLQDGFGQLQVPVAEFVPGEFVDGARGEVEPVAGERLARRLDGAAEP